jgi:hypothetical protein
VPWDVGACHYRPILTLGAGPGVSHRVRRGLELEHALVAVQRLGVLAAADVGVVRALAGGDDVERDVRAGEPLVLRATIVDG